MCNDLLAFFATAETQRVVLDKVLLCLSGIAVALLTGRLVEQYRRDQAVALELGKARAAAFLAIFQAVNGCEAKLKFASIAFNASPHDAAGFQVLLEELATAQEKMVETLAANQEMVGGGLGFELSEYARHAYFVRRETFEQGKVETARSQLAAIRKKLHEYIPPLNRA